MARTGNPNASLEMQRVMAYNVSLRRREMGYDWRSAPTEVTC
jgi:hypothetical protein